jgi:hypothetical protein
MAANRPGDTMKFRAGVFGILLLCFTVSPLLADEVLYCTDTASTGFKWDKEGDAARPTRFELQRFTIKVISDTQRTITPMIGDTAGNPFSYSCITIKGRMECEFGGAGSVPWTFHGNTYVRAFLAGPPIGGGDPNIYIAYGTCTKF